MTRIIKLRFIKLEYDYPTFPSLNNNLIALFEWNLFPNFQLIKVNLGILKI